MGWFSNSANGPPEPWPDDDLPVSLIECGHCGADAHRHCRNRACKWFRCTNPQCFANYDPARRKWARLFGGDK